MTSKIFVITGSGRGGLAFASRLFHVPNYAYMDFMIRLIALSLTLFAAPALAQDVPFAGAGADDRIIPDSRAQVQLSFAPVVREAAPAVVNVYTTRLVRERVSFFSNRTREREQNSLGSGVIVDPSGVIVTNYHVVQGASELQIVLADRREFQAEILLTDEATDLAVLKVETDEPLPVLPYDTSGGSEVGDLVLAIGNPFGVGQTVTSGIVSALARTDVGGSDFASFIQTDAAINPGNSGGALVDMDGELIGVNTMIFSRSGGSNGIGFAIPVDMVRRVVDSALTEGELIRPWLGARLQPVTSDLAGAFGLDRPRGALVDEIYPDAAADDAGLRQGDIVLAVDGHAVNNDSGALFRLATHAAGDDATFTILREGREVDLQVPVLPAPGSAEPQPFEPTGANPFQGLAMVELNPTFNQAYGIDPFADGLIVTNVQRRSIAAGYGFRPGDRLTEIQGQRVRDLNGFEAVLRDFDGAADWPVAIERRGRRQEAEIQLY